MNLVELPSNALGALEAVLLTRDTLAEVAEWCSGAVEGRKLVLEVAGSPLTVPFGCYVVRFDAGFGLADPSWVIATLNGADTGIFAAPS